MTSRIRKVGLSVAMYAEPNPKHFLVEKNNLHFSINWTSYSWSAVQL